MADNNTSTEHWWRVAYGLKRLRKGLEHFVDRRSRAVYTDFYINGLTSAVCNTCQLNRQCPNGVYKTTTRNHNSFCRNNFCDCICDRILLKYYPYQKTPIWANTDSTKWSDRNIGYWEVAKCFLRCPGYLDKKGPNTMDASGLLNICLNNTDIRSSISNIPIFEEVRDIRNKVNHSSDYKLDKQTADDYLGKMIEVLNDANELRHDNFAVVNRRRLNEIKDGNIKCSSKESIRRELDISAHEKNNVEKDEAYMFDSSQMSEERIHFTATLVRMYALFKEEMEKKTALRLRKYLLPRAFLCDKDEARQWCRKSLVDDILKRIIFSSCETTKKRFQEQFAKDKAGAELSRKFEQCNVLTKEIEEFRNLQKRRTREQFEYKKCVRYIAMVNPLNDLDMIADKLLSAYIINLAEHSDIVQTHDKDLKLDMFKTAISRCDKGVLPLLKDKCVELHIRCILYEDDESPERGVEEKSTEDAILSSPNVKWFLSQEIIVILTGSFLNRKNYNVNYELFINSEFFNIISKQYSDPHTMFTCSCKIVKREEEPLCIETSLVRGPAAKDELTQTGNFSEATAIARDMQPELHTETKNGNN
ncbi:hypothetical protein MAR_037467 [Mya arenaria]|uniref:DZIP3-like HEPN domain-containing protein n=1 Tax=Mya arenaria TaxID=6604 RepID=A0ABY7FSK6_MYAAR|nr:hypothetical protein MAR_037467 [Mya arenaria]